ncbi:MAG: glycosyltransferase [Bryobacteraceae bacterium]|nr:glycosyltransferase [Bryobacteraceae bacterium]
MLRPMEETLVPRVTALIVSRDCETELRQCLESLEASKQRIRLEILVVDDGSQDGTPDVPSEFPDVITLRLPKRLGTTRSTNIGLRTAKGELILLLPPTYRVGPETVQILATRLEANADVGAVCPSIPQAWSFPTPASLQLAWKTGDLPGAVSIEGSGEHSVEYPQGSPMLVRRDLLRAMHFLDERFGDRWADLELCSRIRGGGKSILVLSDVNVSGAVAPEKELTELEWTDSANGVATWIGLHGGSMAGVLARMSMAFYALGRGKTGVFTGILSGSKIDGNQD